MDEVRNNANGAMVATAPTAPAQVGFAFFDPLQFETMQRVCKLFASSELVPDIYQIKHKPIPKGASEQEVAALVLENKASENKAIANCMVALEMAQRIGASPLMIMQNMTPIYGKPSWSSKFLVATVNTCGRFNPLQYRFTDKGMLGMVDYTDYVWDGQTRSKRPVTKQFDGRNVMDVECVAYTTAKGSNKMLESAPVSIRLAIQEGWYTKNGSKWQTMTRQMLIYRAASFWTNAYAPELSMGMRTVEEYLDIEDVDYQEIRDDAEAEKTKRANQESIGGGLGDDAPVAAAPAPAAPASTESGAAATDSTTKSPGF